MFLNKTRKVLSAHSYYNCHRIGLSIRLPQEIHKNYPSCLQTCTILTLKLTQQHDLRIIDGARVGYALRSRVINEAGTPN